MNEDMKKVEALLRELRSHLVSGSEEMGILDEAGKALGLELWKVDFEALRKHEEGHLRYGKRTWDAKDECINPRVKE